MSLIAIEGRRGFDVRKSLDEAMARADECDNGEDFGLHSNTRSMAELRGMVEIARNMQVSGGDD